MINTYYILQNNEQLGPYTHDELINMQIDGTTMVHSPLTKEWQYAAELPELQNYFESIGIYLPTSANQAGFWWRALAYIIDYVLLMIVMTILGALVGVIAGLIGHGDFDWDSQRVDVVFRLFGVVLFIFYHAIFEAIQTQGSVGKIICKLIVVNPNGERLNFTKAFTRNLSKLVSSLLCGLGFLAALNIQKQTWHDQMSKTNVIRRMAKQTKDYLV